MAANEQAALVVRLEAKFDKLEKQLKDVGVLAEKSAKGIEDSFANVNPSLAGRVGGIVAALNIQGLVQAAIEKISELINYFDNLSKAAKFAGVSIEEAFALEKLGISTQTLEKAADILDRLQRGEKGTTIAEIFRLNDKDVDNLRDAVGFLTVGFEAVKAAANEVQARIVGQAFGMTNAEIENIRNGTTSLEEFRVKLIEVAGAGLEVRKKLEETTSNFQKMNEVAQESGGWLQTIANVFNEITGNVSTMTPQLREAAIVLQRINQVFQTMKEAGGTVGEQFERGKPPPPTKLPSLAPKPDAVKKEQVSSLQRLVIEQEKQTNLAKSELQLIGATNTARAVGRAEVEVQAAIQKDIERGLKITPELIKQRTEAIKENAAAEAEYLQKIREVNDAVSTTKNVMSDALKTFVSALQEGKSAADAMRDSLKRVADLLLDKSINLALNMLIAGNTTGTGIGGPLGAGIAGLFPARQHGGPVTAGRSYIVGEDGPELVRFGRNGMVIPNAAVGSSGGGVSVQIINNGAQVSQSSKRRSDGGTDLRVVIDAAVSDLASTPGTSTNRALRMGSSPLIRRS